MDWSDQAANWDKNPAVRAYSEAAFGSLQQVLRDQPLPSGARRAFDFGCGTGLLTAAIARIAGRVVALDTSSAMVDVLDGKRIANVASMCAQVDDALGGPRLPLGPFDLVTSSSVCGFLDDYPGTIALLASLLAPGGVLVQWDWERDPNGEETMGLTREEITRALRAAGLQRVSVEVGFDVVSGEHRMAPLQGVGWRV